MNNAGTCRACGAPMIWSKMDKTGKPNPLDVEDCGPQKGAVAYNPATGGGHTLTADERKLTHENQEKWARWRAAGVTLHLSHFATCPERARFRRE